MVDQFCLSERMPDFQSHRSLLDEPWNFQSSVVAGCVFYLPCGANLGGDSFEIRSGESLTMLLAADMASHGQDGRERLKPYYEDIDKILEIT